MSTPTPMPVKQISECFIKPKHQLEEHKNPVYLSPWDLLMLSARYMQRGVLYSTPSHLASDDQVDTLIDELKEALSVTLVHFHFLAGQLETQLLYSDEEGGKTSSLVFIDPTKGPGARFIHASADLIRVSDVFSPGEDIPLVMRSLFDHDGAVSHDGHHLSLMTIQVTRLLDGIFIGFSMNHCCGDGTSYWHFFKSLSEIFMKKYLNGGDDDDHVTVPEISRPPIHTRMFLDGTGPKVKLPFAHPDEFITRSVAAPDDPLPFRERFFHFSSESIRKIKSRANSETNSIVTISSFQALSALTWRCITRARKVAPDQTVTCKLVINNRGRLDPPISDDCFGNCIYSLQSKAKAGELLEQSLGWAALKLNQTVRNYGDKEVRALYAGWMRAPIIYQMGRFLEGFDVVVGGSPRFDVYGIEFGMGKPVAVLTGFNQFDGKVTSYPGREGGGSIDLSICLLPEYMRALETDDEFMSMVG